MLTLPLDTPLRWSVHNGEQLPPHSNSTTGGKRGTGNIESVLLCFFYSQAFVKKRGFGGGRQGSTNSRDGKATRSKIGRHGLNCPVLVVPKHSILRSV